MNMDSTQIANARLLLADQGTDATQSIQITNATGGSFTITWDGHTTGAIAWSAGSGDVQNAFCALPNVGVGNALVILNAGVPGSVFYVISFAGTLGNAAQPVITVTSSLTGMGVIVTVQQVTAGGVTAFSIDELDSQYTLANQNFFLAISYLFNVLWSNAAKFNDYVAGQTEEKKSQIARQLKELAEYYYNLARASSQVQLASMIPVPPRPTAIPYPSSTPAISLSYRPPFNRNRGWGGGW